STRPASPASAATGRSNSPASARTATRRFRRAPSCRGHLAPWLGSRGHEGTIPATRARDAAEGRATAMVSPPLVLVVNAGSTSLKLSAVVSGETEAIAHTSVSPWDGREDTS